MQNMVENMPITIKSLNSAYILFLHSDCGAVVVREIYQNILKEHGIKQAQTIYAQLSG